LLRLSSNSRCSLTMRGDLDGSQFTLEVLRLGAGKGWESRDSNSDGDGDSTCNLAFFCFSKPSRDERGTSSAGTVVEIRAAKTFCVSRGALKLPPRMTGNGRGKVS
jgi:hypothetical protein